MNDLFGAENGVVRTIYEHYIAPHTTLGYEDACEKTGIKNMKDVSVIDVCDILRNESAKYPI